MENELTTVGAREHGNWNSEIAMLDAGRGRVRDRAAQIGRDEIQKSD